MRKNVEQRGIQLPGKEKDLSIYQEFFTFLQEHIPERLSIATGKVRSKKHILNRKCDILIYRKWCSRLLNMAGGYVIIDSLHCFLTLEQELTTENLYFHVALTNAMKSLYESVNEVEPGDAIPVFSAAVAYQSSIPLLSHKIAIKDAARERDIPVNHEPDLICVLNNGLIIKDWENGGDYKVVETGPDTLMWFYILLLEYLDRNGEQELDLRNYIKNVREYKEY